jgi:hypothetical protein
VIGLQPGTACDTGAPAGHNPVPKLPSHTSKLSILVAGLRQPHGATMDELIAASGWQKHSVRGAISGALKARHKLTVQSNVIEGWKSRLHEVCTWQRCQLLPTDLTNAIVDCPAVYGELTLIDSGKSICKVKDEIG